MSTSSLVWAVIVGTIVILLVVQFVLEQLRSRRIRERTHKMLPNLSGEIGLTGRYRLVLTSGSEFSDIKFLGLSSAEELGSLFLPFPLQQSLVLEKSDGKRVFVRPNAIRFFEEI